MGPFVIPALAFVALYLFAGLRVLREYERAVYFFLGRSWGAKGPGLIYLPPVFAKMQKVSLRVVALDIPPQDVITRDNISLKVNAVLYMRVKDSVKAVNGASRTICTRRRPARPDHAPLGAGRNAARRAIDEPAKRSTTS